MTKFESIVIHFLYWLNLAAYIAGLCVTFCAFRRSRKWGYLLIACSFALFIVSVYILPPVFRAINAHRAPDISAEMEQKMHDAIQKATDQVLQQEGRPYVPAFRLNYRIPLAQILLVIGLWLIARREPPANAPPP